MGSEGVRAMTVNSATSRERDRRRDGILTACLTSPLRFCPKASKGRDVGLKVFMHAGRSGSKLVREEVGKERERALRRGMGKKTQERRTLGRGNRGTKGFVHGKQK